MIPALLAIGIHLASAHSEPGFNNINPGLYAVASNGMAAGVYHNSHRKTSAWAGQVWESDRVAIGSAGVRGALTAGLVTGYPRSAVLPFGSASVAVDIGGHVSVRAAFLPNPLPKAAHVIHFSLEYKL